MDTQKMMGRAPEPKVSIDVRYWDAAKLALWRSKVAWDIAIQQATEVLPRCRHEPGCAGEKDETEPCLAECPDREIRMSVLVILNAARQFAPIDAKKVAQAPYVAPTREYFSAVLAELAACQAQLADLTRSIPAPLPPAIEGKKE